MESSISQSSRQLLSWKWQLDLVKQNKQRVYKIEKKNSCENCMNDPNFRENEICSIFFFENKVFLPLEWKYKKKNNNKIKNLVHT